MSTFHTPVMLEQVVNGLRVEPGKRYVDATVGGGGHGIEILNRGGKLLGIDADSEAVEETKRIFNFQFSIFKEGKDWKIIQGNFRNIETIAKENGFNEVDGVLFDLGVSSYQLDTPSRGFSYRFEGAPLDLRMNQAEGENAADVVNTAPEEELYEIFAKFGEEELAGTIAHALVIARRIEPIQRTGQFVGILKQAVGERHIESTLSRVFQALRMVINSELTALEQGLGGAKNLLVPGGRLVVLSFHSLEDRVVKRFMKQGSFRIITGKPIRVTQTEIIHNRRARSAKLRIAEKI